MKIKKKIYLYNMKYNFTYQTKNLINGKTYIGVHSTNDLNDGYFGSGILIKKAIKKYGIENFKMIPLNFFDTISEAYIEEMWLVDKKWILNENNYNITLGGYGGFGHITYEQQRSNLGKKFSKEHKSKLSESLKGVKKSEIHCKNISISRSGENHENWGKTSGVKGHKFSKKSLLKCSIAQSGKNNSMFGKTHSDYWRKNHSEFMIHYFKENAHHNKGIPMSDEQKLKVSESCRNQKTHSCTICGKVTTAGNIARWHNDNCRRK